MRSAEELRNRWLELIPHLTARPSMYASLGGEMDLAAGTLLSDLCFLDDRDEDYEKIREDLRRRYGKRGVAGPFAAMFGLDQCQAEVAAVYSEVFSRLGYLDVEPKVSPDRWAEMIASLPVLIEGRDLRLSEAEQKLGRASLVVDRRILCYASSRPSDGWVFVEAQAEITRRYDPQAGHYQADRDRDPVVRSVRLSARGFENGLILSRYGKNLRWGEGWWLEHPERSATPESLAIAAQLRELRDADPSEQPGRGPRP